MLIENLLGKKSIHDLQYHPFYQTFIRQDSLQRQPSHIEQSENNNREIILPYSTHNLNWRIEGGNRGRRHARKGSSCYLRRSVFQGLVGLAEWLGLRDQLPSPEPRGWQVRKRRLHLTLENNGFSVMLAFVITHTIFLELLARSASIFSLYYLFLYSTAVTWS